MTTDAGWSVIVGMAFLASLTLTAVSVLLLRPIALRRGWVDRPGGRRIHSEPTPNVGGIAVTVGATVPLVTVLGLFRPDVLFRPEVAALVGGGLATLGLGFIDDQRGLSAWLKFGLEWIVGSIAFWAGARILGAGIGPAEIATLPLWASYGITVFWIVGATNAFNLIDGSDGIAGGAAAFASVTLAVVFLLNGEPVGLLAATILAGAALGFLLFNFPPASIFLGDGGSLFLGYTLAVLGVITTTTASTLLALAIPLFAFAVPLLDTSIAILRRFLRREPIFSPDRGHIHHRLRDLGHSPRAVALSIYGVCAVFAALSLLLATSEQPAVLPVLAIAGLILILLVQRLRVPELMQLTAVLGRGFQQRAVIRHNVRLLSSADALRETVTASDLVAALQSLIEESEFARLRLDFAGDPSFLERLGLTSTPGALVLTPGDESSRWGERGASLVEVRVPVRVAADTEGVLCLFRPAAGERLYTDIRLLATPLSDSLAMALRRLQFAHSPGWQAKSSA